MSHFSLHFNIFEVQELLANHLDHNVFGPDVACVDAASLKTRIDGEGGLLISGDFLEEE